MFNQLVPKRPKLIIGLGNPGREYHRTYHNLGQSFIDYLAGREKTKFKKTNNFLVLKKGRFYLIKPQVFVNESGRAVKQILRHFRAGKGEMIIAHDDADIALGQFKLTFGRGSAGHKGIEDIIRTLNTKDFWRLRFGIRKNKGKAGQFVLQPLPSADQAVIKKLFAEIKEELFKT
jgi:PTH1 family peptidyl-tRNA hydrolase